MQWGNKETLIPYILRSSKQDRQQRYKMQYQEMISVLEKDKAVQKDED